MSGDIAGHMAITPMKYECLDCGWRENALSLKRPTDHWIGRKWL
jgi:hypothetical protein